jgi:hypothetical protein
LPLQDYDGIEKELDERRQISLFVARIRRDEKILYNYGWVSF